jgi:serine/threonine protein phosphatase PrpC
MLKGFKAIAQGASHKETGKPCQDAADVRYTNAPFACGLAIVADGHGGDKYFRSEVGSKCAIAVTQKMVAELASEITAALFSQSPVSINEREKLIEGNLRLLKTQIVSSWKKTVAKHYEKHPLSEAEQARCQELHLDLTASNVAILYGTTLLVGFMTETFWFAMQIGDGLCVLLDEKGNPKTPIPEDENQGFGTTNSLCNSNAVEKFYHTFGFSAMQGIAVCTDGVADSFEKDKYLEFLTILRKKFADFPDRAEAELQTWLPGYCAQGSRDDVAIAGVWRIEESKQEGDKE